MIGDVITGALGNADPKHLRVAKTVKLVVNNFSGLFENEPVTVTSKEASKSEKSSLASTNTCT